MPHHSPQASSTPPAIIGGVIGFCIGVALVLSQCGIPKAGSDALKLTILAAIVVGCLASLPGFAMGHFAGKTKGDHRTGS